jgi:hypothetical protein
LFSEASKTIEDYDPYLEAIENILSIKVKNAKEIIVKNMETII